MMATITISVDGNEIFSWDGDDASIKNILEAFPRAARHVDLTPHELADNCIAHLRSGQLCSANSVGQEMQMMGVIWHILEAETDHPEHPGRIADLC
jgi:hypothetical protein